MTEVWTKWEGEVIKGAFPLRRFLSGSDHSGVFLTEYKAQNFPSAAIKIVPADPALTEAQLSHWRTAATLSHPHLIRLLDAGRCQLGGHQFLFVVMEYAEETLSQILPYRALTPDEVREMLLPTLNALAFLHGKNLVQGQLKPSNILVVEDQLKLASDTVRPAGESTANIARSSVYDPPEAIDGSFSAAGDIWGLGITLVEALTQHPPAWPDDNFETASITSALPAPFAEIVRQCLNRNPADRPSVAAVAAQLKPVPLVRAPAAPPAPAAAPVRAVTSRDITPGAAPKRRWFAPAIAALLLAVAVVWIGVHRLSSRASLERAAASTAASQAPATTASAPPDVSAPSSDQRAQPTASRYPFVLHEEIPDVPRSARDTIRGHIKVAVRVTVDSSGKVVDESLDNPGRNKYFARLAAEAARKWKFEPADNQNSRKWVLRFEFTRRGAAAHAANPRGGS